MIEHKGSDARTAPLGPREDEGDVGLVAVGVGHEEGTADRQPLVGRHATVLGVLQSFCH